MRLPLAARQRLRLAALVAAAALLAGCDYLGIESGTVQAERKTADGKAIGAACRHAGRAIEDCYALNKKAEKAAIYAGWREMDDYMRENKLEPVAPELGPKPTAKAESEAKDEAAIAKEGTSAEASSKEAKAEPADRTASAADKDSKHAASTH